MNRPAFKGAEQPDRTKRYVDTPQGIWTLAGHHFRTTEALLQEYAGPVLARTPLDQLLNKANDWIRSPENLAVCLLPILLLNLPIGQALGITALVYAVWKVLAPALVSVNLLGLFSFIEKVPVQALVYITVLSLLGMREQYLELGIGVGFFVFVRWGGLGLLTNWLFGALHRVLFSVPVNDKILKSLIVRIALRHRLSLPELDAVEEKLVNLARKK